MGTNEWVAIGTLLTAAFTGFTAWWTWAHRPSTRVEIELASLSFDRCDMKNVIATFKLKNVGSSPIHSVRTFVAREGLPDKQVGPTLASLAAGESLEFTRAHIARWGEQELDEETGRYPNPSPDFDPKNMMLAVTWTQPPRYRRTKDLRVLESELLSDFRRRYQPLG